MRTLTILLTLAACAGGESTTSDTTGSDTGTAIDTTDTADALDQAPGNPDIPLADCEMLAEYDNDGDGLPDFSARYQYSSLGLVSVYETDSGANGTYDTRYEYTYDASGALVAYTMDSGLDGVEYSVTYVRDGDGDLVAVAVDSDNDGDTDQAITLTYDDDKRLQREEFDDGDDGSIDDLYTHAWSDNGDGTWTDARSLDFGNDGEVNMLTHTITDAEDRMLELWMDQDGDALWEQYEAYTYTDAGSIDTRIVAFLDDAGEEFDTSYSWKYLHDEWGRTDYVDVHTLSISLNLDFWAVNEFTYTCQ